MKPLADCRLYTFVDTTYLRGRDPREVARQLCEGGADLVQLRAKDWRPDRIECTGADLLTVCDRHDVGLVINDHPEIAARIGAPLAHLGQEDFFVAGHRHTSEIVVAAGGSARPDPLRIGLSTHAPDQAARSVAAGAAYIALGPIHATPTKPGRAPVTLEYVRWASRQPWSVPWFAIGGLTIANLDEVLAAGARRVCVVSAILNAPDVTAACREFRRRLAV